MGCALTTEQYIPVVENLIKLNPEKYKDFDNAAKFILEADLTDEQKKLALHNMAHIYNGLSGLNATKYSIGKGLDVINSVILIDDTAEYLKNAFKTFDLKRPRVQSLDAFDKAVEELASQRLIAPDDLNPALNLIKNFINSQKFESVNERTEMINYARAALKNVINNLKTDATYNKVMFDKIDLFLDTLQPKSSYIPISKIMDGAGLSNVLVFKTDGTMVEAIESEGVFFENMDDGTVQEINPEVIAETKNARPADWSDSNDGKQIFRDDFFLSGLTVTAVDPSDNEAVMDELNKMASPSSGITITAVRIGNVGEARVERMKELANEDPEMAGLINRNHETFENSTQVAKLESDPNAKVLTVSRPKSSEQEFALVGRINATGTMFHIYSMENFVFVSADNTTERLDLTNPGHLELLRALSLRRTGGTTQELQDSDIAAIVASQKMFQEFKEKIASKVENAFMSGSSIDVTDDFLNMYDFTSQRSGEKTKTSLKDIVEKNPQFSKEVTVVKLDANGKVVSEEQRKIPFYITKQLDKSLGKMNYTHISMLSPDERIKVTTATGDVYLTELQYGDEVLKLNDVYQKLFEKEDAERIERFKAGKSEFRVAKTTQFVLKFMPDGNISYAVVDSVPQLEYPEFFARFITVLSQVINPQTGTKGDAVKNMNYNTYEFKPLKPQNSSQYALSINFAVSAPQQVAGSPVKQPLIQIEVRPYSQGEAAEKYRKIINVNNVTKKNYNFILPESAINNLAALLKNDKAVQTAKNEVPALAKYDLNDPNQVLEFYEQVFELAKLPTAPESIKKLTAIVEKEQEKFTQLVIDTVTKAFKANPRDEYTGVTAYGEFIKALKEDFGDNFSFDNLVAFENENGKNVLNIQSPNKSSSDPFKTRATFNKTMKNVSVVESSGRRSFSLVSKAAVNVSVADVESQNENLTQEEQAIVNEVADKENSKLNITPDSSAGSINTDETSSEEDDIEDVPPFSIAKELGIDVATQQDIATEAEWLAENLPMWGLDTKSMRTMIDLARIDGTVLGMFKDKVIYLNDIITAKGTVYHEAFHGVFRYLLSDKERTSLIKEVVENSAHASKFTAENVEEFARVRNLSTTNYDQLVELIAEEILADGFQNYMLKSQSSAPKTAMQRFFDMLKKLINFFIKNRSEIEYIYDRVKTGYYKTATIKSNVFDGQVAFELIPGLKEIRMDNETVARATTTLSEQQQRELVNMVVREIFNDNVQSDGFDARFNRAVDKILTEVYSMEKLVAKNPSARESIERTYGPLISSYRFMLGARMKGLNVNDINLTGNSKYDNKTEPNSVTLITGEIIDNTLGQYSFERLRSIVKDAYDKTNSIQIARDEDDFTIDSTEVEQMYSGENSNTVRDEERASAEEEVESNDFDTSMGEYNRMDSYVAQVRRFFATIRSDVYDETNGIYFPRVVNSQEIFSTLLYTTSGIQPRLIIDSIKTMADTLIEDGNVQTGNDLLAIYNEIQTKTKNGQTNDQLLKLITEVLHGVELNYVFVNVNTPATVSMDNVTAEALDRAQSVNFRIFDKVLDTDITKKRNDIIASFIKKHSSQGNTAEFKEAVAYLKEFATTFMSSPDILSSVSGQTVKLNQLTDKVHKAFETIGMKMPKSLVRLSIMAMNAEENKIPLTVDAKYQMFYDINNQFVKQQQYLEKDFFRSLKVMLEAAYTQTGNPSSAIRNILDDEKSSNKDAKRLLVILKKASAYAVKVDPSGVQSVIKNAEGKPIYRFAKWNPLLMLSQKLNTMTLEEALEDDPYFENTLRSFMEDNPLLGKLLRGEKSTETEKIDLFLKNFTVAMFGGVQQRIGDVAKTGSTFKNVDQRSLHMLQLLAFMDKKTVADKNGNQITTYLRSFHQLESTSTNFLVSALYEPFTSKDASKTNNKGQLLYEGKYLKIVEDLAGIVNQEYNRMSREWSRRNQLKTNYEQGVSNDLINKYNAVLEKDGVTVNVDNDNLRAYKFNILSDFFDNPENETLRDELTALAKSGQPFEELSEDQRKMLLEALDKFAKKEFQVYLDTLEKLELISKKEIPTSVRDPRPSLPTTYYASEMLPDELKQDYAKSKVSEKYPQPLGAKQDANLDSVEGLLFDMFMSHWRNSLNFNQLMDGDMALNVKNAQDYVKRLKKIVATGSNMKEGTHKVAYMNTIVGFIHEEMPQYGPYYSKEEIISDFTIPNEGVREQLLEGYDKAINGTVEVINGRKVKWEDMMREIFDGQSISSIMHQMDMHQSLGRLDDRAIYILIAKHYRALTKDEMKYLESKKIVNNAKKTITADRNIYHKLSEGYIDRTDSSRLIITPREGESKADATARVYDELHGLYMAIYDYRKEKEYLATEADAENNINSINLEIENLYKTIHGYYEPLPNRQILHDLLNSMDVFQIDQIMDTTASKNATLLPIDITKSENKTENGYINLQMAALNVPNSAKYLQVATDKVKEKAKHSVQSKLLLPSNIAGDQFRKIIELESKKAGKDLTEDDIQSIENMKQSLNDYQLSLRQSTTARLLYFKEVLRKGNDFELGKIFTMIRDSLQAQNAPKNILDMFAVKPDGKPVFSPNLSLIRQTLEYYMIAQYSKNVTDEKVSGFKSFHESSFGYNVLVDPVTNQVITTEDYAANPEAYAGKNLRSRPLGVSVEIQPDGSKLYFVEAIIPKPMFENAQQETFFKENLTKMFGVRIPTEDKRSMIAIKVVDYVDSSKLNNIIVPHFVHLLSGSDFDIDSLFGRMMSYYENGKGNYSLYGDYSQYKDINVGQFIEFMHYMSKNQDFGPAMKQRKKELVEQGTLEMPAGGMLYQIMDTLGYSLDDVQEHFDQKFVKSKYTEQKDFTSYMFELTQESKELYVNAKEIAEQNPENRELAKTRNEYGRELADLKSIRQTSVNEQKLLKEKIRYIDTLFEYQAMMDVLSRYGMPSNVSDFMSRPAFSQMVSPIYENQNLNASLKILANESLFNYLYINQRSSTQEFKDILERFGIDIKEITQKSNLFTVTSMIESKVENNMNKDGIGRTAVMNKFLSLASQYNMKLSDKGKVWVYQNMDGKLVTKDTFGQINENDQRVIAIIGNILGMFADGAKDPIPAALQMNEINTSTTLAMIGVGLDPDFAVAFNFLPEVRKASLAVQQSQFALSEGLEQDYKFYNTAVSEQLAELINENPDEFNRLKAAGFFTSKSFNANPVIDKPTAIRIGFTPKKLSIYALKNNELTPSAIGFDMVYDKTNSPLSDVEAKMVLLTYYAKQAQQTWAINRAAKVTNLFKRLNPSLVAFDKMRAAVDELMLEEKLFTSESSARMFANDQVWSVLKEALEDANEQFSKIFLERTPFFAPITETFRQYFEDPKTISNTLTSFLGISKFKNTFPGSRKFKSNYAQALVDKDDAMLLKTFTPEYWFTNDLFAQIEFFREKYPDNEFLKLLRSADSKNTATVIYNGKTYQGVAERFITIIGKAKIKGDYATKVSNGIAELYNKGLVEERQFVKNLFYHDLVRTGLQYKEGSYIQYMPAELIMPISDSITEFIEGIQDANASPNFEESFENFIKNYTGENTEAGIVSYFDEMFNQIAYAAASEKNNQKIPKFQNKGTKGKMNTKSVMFTVNYSKPQFTKPIIKAFIKASEKVDSETQVNAKIKAIEFTLDALGLKLDEGTDLSRIESLNIADVIGGDFTINLSNSNEKATIALGGMFGIRKDMTEFEKTQFIFPSILKVGTKTYVLQGVDGNATAGKSLGSNLYDSIMGKTVMNVVGTKAKYSEIPAQYASEALSPIGFTTQNAESYQKYVSKKEAIVFNTGSTSAESAPTQAPVSNVEKDVKDTDDVSTKQLTENTGTIVEGMSSEKDASLSQIQAGEDFLKALLGVSAKPSKSEQSVPALQRGRYVEYNGETYIVTQQNKNGTWQIYNPLIEGAGAKIPVAESNMKPLKMLAKIVEYKDSQYIVTSKNTIISLKSNKKMMWGENDGNRKAILALAEQNKIIVAPPNRPSIDLTDENNCGG